MKRLLLGALALWGTQNYCTAQTTSEAYWNFTGGANAAVSPSNVDLSVSALTSGNNLGSAPTLISSTSPSGTYTFTLGGVSGTTASSGNNAGAAAKTGAFSSTTSTYFEVTFTPAAGTSISVSSVNFGSRSTGTAPQAYTISTNVGGFASPVASGTLPNSSSWVYRTNSFGAAVNGAAGSAITLRIYGHGGTGSPGSGTTNWRIDDLVITVTTSASGQPACVAPATTPTGLSFPTTTTSSIDGAFTAASGGADGYIVFSSSTTGVAPTLTDGTTYNAGNAPVGYTFVSSGPATTFSASGLTQGTSYNFFVFAYNNANCVGGPAYTTTALTGAASTQSFPACATPSSASNVSITASSNTASGTLTAPVPASDSFIIFYAFGTTPPPTVANGTTYNAANTPPGYGLVSKQEGANTSFTIVGLSPSAQYSVYVIAYNNIGCTGGPAYAAASSATFNTTAIGSNVYTWNVAVGNWNSPSSWTPARTAPANTDVLVFDGAVQSAPVATVDFPAAETIGQLKFQNSVAATFLNPSSDRVLTIGAALPGDDLDVPAGNKLTVQSTTANAGLTLSVTSGNTGIIADSVRLGGNTGVGGQDHLILSADPSGIIVTATGVVTQATGFTGNAFGSAGTQNTVEFQGSATFVQGAGSNAFGFGAGQSKVLFSPTANYVVSTGGGVSPAVSGRTYPNLIVAGNTTASSTGSSTFTVNNISVEAGSSYAINLNNPGAIVVNGNITANGPLTLNSGNGGLALTASNPVIGGSDRVSILDRVSVANLTLANTDSVVLDASVMVTGALTLSAGRVVVLGTDTLILGTSAAAPGTLNYTSGVIEGMFTRYFAASTNTAQSGLFPMGRPGSGERRLATVEFTTAPTSGGSLTAMLDSTSLNTINATVTTDGTCPSGFTVSSLAGQYVRISAGDGLAGGAYDLTLQHQNPGGVTNLCELAIAKRANPAATWTIDGVQDYGAGTLTEPIVRHTGLSGFSDFIIAGAQSNPLPLGLTHFDAVAVGSTAHLSWTLADAADFKTVSIERSIDGRTFTSIGTALITEDGGRFVDENPLNGRNHYRLLLTNRIGAVLVSAVRTVSLDGLAGSAIVVFPNPAIEVIRVQGTGSISATLFDATGRAVRSINDASGIGTISLEGVASGFYLLHASDGTTMIHERVQVVR